MRLLHGTYQLTCSVLVTHSYCPAANLLSSSGDKPSADMDQLAISFSRLHSALDKVHHYVDDVVVGF